MAQQVPTELIRVYFPGVTSSSNITSLGKATYSGYTVQDIVDEGGPLYIEYDFQGNELVCMMAIYGKVTLFGTFNMATVNPVPVTFDELVGGRPDNRYGKGHTH